MGERALAVCHRRAGVFDLYRSQWAGSESRIASVLEGDFSGRVDALTGCRWDYAGVASASALVETLDYLSLDVVYLVSAYGVDVLVPIWFGIPTVEETDVTASTGALVPVESRRSLSGLRAQNRLLKDALGTAVERGVLTPAEARRCLRGLYAGAHCCRCRESPATCTLASQHIQ